MNIIIQQSKGRLILAIASVFMLTTIGASGQTGLFKTMSEVDNGTKNQPKRILSNVNKEAAAPNPSSSPLQGNAGLTIPNLGQGFNIVPTPTFNLTQTNSTGHFGYLINLWGNSLGTDSSLQKVAGNLLMPQISLLGFMLEGNYMLTSAKAGFKVGVDAEVNLLVKKVSYYDSVAKSLTNFNPFVIHPRVGLTTSFLESYAFVDAYLNTFSVLTQNGQFKTFFKTNKTTFVYPEVDAGGYINTTSNTTATKYVKFEFDLIINNGDVQTLNNSADKVIPYIKVGYVTSL
jgi:hypothetical protein